MTAALLLLTLAAAPKETPQLLVTEIAVPASIEAPGFTEAIAAEVDGRGFFRTVAPKDVQTLMGLERQRQLLGCSDQSNCLAELAGALGTRYVLSGAIARVGEAYQLSLQTLDSQKAQPLGRSVKIARDLETLRKLIPWAVAEATAIPLPPEPSKLPSIALIAGGGLALVASGYFGLDAIRQEGEYRRELELGTTRANVLQAHDFYASEASRLGTQRSLSLVGLGVGAALVGVGIYLFPGEATRSSGGFSVKLSGSGVRFAGLF